MSLDAYLMWRFPPRKPFTDVKHMNKYLCMLKSNDDIMERVRKHLNEQG